MLGYYLMNRQFDKKDVFGIIELVVTKQVVCRVEIVFSM